MGTVFGKNTTSSSITVAGHKVYYIDSTDAEIVEVEKTSGQALPSVGDTVTFGNYPQATSTPEPIEWTVLDVDSVNGKALLLSKYILDAHVYNAEKVSVSWATCTLRDWINNTFYNAAFNSEEQSGIVTTHNAGSGLSSDDKVFCLTQNEAASYFPVEADRRAVATRKAIDDGASTAQGYGYWWNLDWDVDSYYRADMIATSGGASSAIIIVTWAGVRPAIWVSFSGVTITKYNAFKFTLSGTPYYYVIDGEHDTWTDDLSAWGYSEVPVGPVLPTVETDGFDRWIEATQNSSAYTFSPNETTFAYINRKKATYELSMSYAVVEWRDYHNRFAGRAQFHIGNDGGYMTLTNMSSSSLTFSQAKIARCLSNVAIVITVYDSSNNAYNAFKYTANNTDYYYVLDGTQTDWTDDLSGIGYSLYLTAYMNANGTPEYSYGGQYALYDHFGNLMQSDDTKTYTEIRTYTSSSDTVGESGAISWLRSMSGKLRAYCNTGFTIQRIEYTVS